MSAQGLRRGIFLAILGHVSAIAGVARGEAVTAHLLAQFIQPSGDDPVVAACPKGLTNDGAVDPLTAWSHGKEVAETDGDALGVGSWGHTEEALEWYCKASAGGNAMAAYDIGEIFRDGYVVNSVGPGGRIITRHMLPDLPTAIYWYQISATRGFTKAMVALAECYAFSNQIVSGRTIPRDADKAWLWLNRAADRGDTPALSILASLYAGQRGDLWHTVFPLRIDKDSLTKAGGYVLSALSILNRYRSQCTGPAAVKDMTDALPSVSDGRSVRGASIVAVRGSDLDRPTELDCILSLSGPPPSREDEPVLQQIDRLVHGGAISNWGYTISQMRATSNNFLLRESASEAMVEGIEQIQRLYELLFPPRPSGAKQ